MFLASKVPLWHAGGQEFESPWLHSSKPFHRMGSQGSRKAPFLLPARRKGQVEGKSGFLTLSHRANRDPLLDPLEISQGQRPIPLKGKKGKCTPSPNRWSAAHPACFSQQERGSVATSLLLIWTLPSRHPKGTSSRQGRWCPRSPRDLHPMVFSF